MNQTKYEDTEISIINDQNSNIYETTSSKSKVPNFSQKDNTVNIENIYASQIVEEIRREREKKHNKNVNLKKLYRISVNNHRIVITKSKKSLMKCMQIKLSSTLERVL